MPCKNITRYTYETTAFQGYRLAICKNKRLFTRYFSDSQYGGADAALQEAMRVRDNIFKLFEQGNLTVSQIFAKYTVRSRRQSAADRREKNGSWEKGSQPCKTESQSPQLKVLQKLFSALLENMDHTGNVTFAPKETNNLLKA